MLEESAEETSSVVDVDIDSGTETSVAAERTSNAVDANVYESNGS